MQSSSPYRETIRVALPLIISMGSFTAMQFTDRLFLAWYDIRAFQAALPAGILSFTLVCFFMEVSGYASNLVAQYYGAKMFVSCSRVTVQSFWLALLSWPLMCLLWWPGQYLLDLAGHEMPVRMLEHTYFSILMAGSVNITLSAAASSFFTGLGATRITMMANLVANVCNIVLDYLMIFGKFGFPEMGIAGAAWATVISGFLAPLILLGVFLSRRMQIPFKTRQSFVWDSILMKKILRFGAPSAVTVVLDVGSFMIFVLLTGRLGELPLAVSNMALSINNFAFMPLVGFGLAAATLVGQYQGRGDSNGAHRIAWTALKIGLVYTGVLALSFVLMPGLYFSLYTARSAGASYSAEQLLALGRPLLLLMAAWGLFDAVSMILCGALKGAGDTSFVMKYSLAMAWGLWVTGQFVVIFICKGGILAFWMWMTFYIMVLAVGYLYRFQRGRWRKIQMIEKGLLC